MEATASRPVVAGVVDLVVSAAALAVVLNLGVVGIVAFGDCWECWDAANVVLFAAGSPPPPRSRARLGPTELFPVPCFRFFLRQTAASIVI